MLVGNNSTYPENIIREIYLIERNRNMYHSCRFFIAFNITLLVHVFFAPNIVFNPYFDLINYLTNKGLTKNKQRYIMSM